jgi:hypothetical protein
MSLLQLPVIIEHLAQDDRSKFVRVLVGLSKLAGLVFVFSVGYLIYTRTYTLGEFGDILFRFSFIFLLFATAIIGLRALSRSEKITLNQVVLKLLFLFLVLPALIAVFLLVGVWIFNPEP